MQVLSLTTYQYRWLGWVDRPTLNREPAAFSRYPSVKALDACGQNYARKGTSLVATFLHT
jgi:hypothetical protein